jgi:hypothetical protein
MAVMTTVLTEFGGQGNTREYTVPTHTVQSTRKVLQRRKVPSQGKVVAEDTVTVYFSTVDTSGARLQETIRISASVVRPINGSATDVAAALTLFREVVASDEFANVVNTQEFLG